MRLTIFGATGGTGRQLVAQALAAGHEVTAVVRDPARLALPADSRLAVRKADVLDPEAVGATVADADAVLTAIGPHGNKATTVSRDSVHSIIEAMNKAGTRRLLTVSGTVVADEGEGVVMRYTLKPLVRNTVLKHVATDMLAAEAEVEASGLDWTVFRPPRLTDKPASGSYRTAVDANVKRGVRISRADLAACMLASIGDPATIRRRIGVAD